jgi:hypothetical protein
MLEEARLGRFATLDGQFLSSMEIGGATSGIVAVKAFKTASSGLNYAGFARLDRDEERSQTRRTPCPL